jgi:hypothetical protein
VHPGARMGPKYRQRPPAPAMGLAADGLRALAQEDPGGSVWYIVFALPASCRSGTAPPRGPFGGGRRRRTASHGFA